MEDAIIVSSSLSDEKKEELFKFQSNPFYYTNKYVKSKDEKYSYLWINVLIDPLGITNNIHTIIELLEYKVDHIIYSARNLTLSVEIGYDEEFIVILHFKKSDGSIYAGLSVNIADEKIYPLIKHFITEYAFYRVAVNRLEQEYGA